MRGGICQVRKRSQQTALQSQQQNNQDPTTHHHHTTHVAPSHSSTNQTKQQIVINPEISTPFVNFTHRDKHFIFGDGCAASIIQKDSSSKHAFKIIDRKLFTQFSNNIRSNYSYLNRAAVDAKDNEELLFHQNGRGVFRDVCPLVASLISDQLEKNNIKPEEVSKFWLHQANGKMIRLITSKILNTDNFDESITPMPITEFGNLASVGSLFAFNLNNNLIQGQKGVICSFGAGYSVCSIIVEKS